MSERTLFEKAKPRSAPGAHPGRPAEKARVPFLESHRRWARLERGTDWLAALATGGHTALIQRLAQPINSENDIAERPQIQFALPPTGFDKQGPGAVAKAPSPLAMAGPHEAADAMIETFPFLQG